MLTGATKQGELDEAKKNLVTAQSKQTEMVKACRCTAKAKYDVAVAQAQPHEAPNAASWRKAEKVICALDATSNCPSNPPAKPTAPTLPAEVASVSQCKTTAAAVNNDLLECFTQPTGNSRAVVSTVAGQASGHSRNSVSHVDGDGSAARFRSPYGMVSAPDSSAIYLTDSWASTAYVRKMATSSPYTVSTVAGGASGYKDAAVGTDAKFDYANGHTWALTISPDGRYLYVADTATVRRIDLQDNNRVTTIAGSNDHRDCNAGHLKYPLGIACSADGNSLYIAQYGCNNVVKVNVADGQISEVASGFKMPVSIVILDDNALLVGVQGDGTGHTSDNIYKVTIDQNSKATYLRGFDNVRGMSISADKKVLYVSDTYNSQIQAIDVTAATPQKKVIAGKWDSHRFSDGVGEDAQMSFPMGSASTSDGRLFFSDSNNGVLRQIQCPA